MQAFSHYTLSYNISQTQDTDEDDKCVRHAGDRSHAEPTSTGSTDKNIKI